MTTTTSVVAEESFESINDSKANLDHIYNRPDPREYFHELGSLAYNIPGEAKPVFQRLLDALDERTELPVTMLDMGCSYGVNAALLKYDLTMDDLYRHWGEAGMRTATPEEVLERDRAFFGSLDNANDLSVIGLDVAEQAVSYAAEAGILDQGLIANLEAEPLPATLEPDLASVDLVISTGCVGYVSERTFETLLPAVSGGHQPWFANFVLRMFPFDGIAGALSERGYLTETLDGETFVQRRFATDEERDQVLQQLGALGIDPDGRESEGHLHAEFYLSRPRGDAAAAPLERLLAS